METIGEVLCRSPHQLYHHIQQSMNAAENSFFYQFQERPEENWYWKSYEESKEEESSSTTNEEDDDLFERLMKEVDVKGQEMIKKLIAKVERNVPFEEELRDTWHHLRANPGSRMLEKIARTRRVGGGRKRKGESVMRERGLDLEGELKNGRFKVKTVNPAVVKEEGRH